jgi:hypothetical protein
MTAGGADENLLLSSRIKERLPHILWIGDVD